MTTTTEKTQAGAAQTKKGGGGAALFGAACAIAGVGYIAGPIPAGIAFGTFMFFAGMFSVAIGQIRP